MAPKPGAGELRRHSRITKTLRAGKVLIEASQNTDAKTTIAPNSLPAMPQTTVSTGLLGGDRRLPAAR